MTCNRAASPDHINLLKTAIFHQRAPCSLNCGWFRIRMDDEHPVCANVFALCQPILCILIDYL